MEKEEIHQYIENNTLSEETTQESSNQNNQNKPWITILIGLICVFLFFGINLEADFSWDTLFKWGAPNAFDIWNGHVWGLITSNLLHVDFIHIIFNVYWLWFFGNKIELQINKLFYLLLLFSSAFIASTFQLAVSDSTGIGFSGINYAMFGFIFIKSKLDKSNKWNLDERTITLFIFWIFFSLILTYTKIWEIGNAAHFSGLLWGILIGYLTTISNIYLKIILPLCVLALSSVSLISAPWSIGWMSNQASYYHEKQDYPQAKIYYFKILEKDSANEFAQENMKRIKIMELSYKVKELWDKQDYEAAKKVLNEILEIDPNYEWARETLSLLP